MKTLPEIKKGLKELLTEGIDLAIEAMENLLGSSSEAFNNLLLLKARYKACNKKLLTGLISDADAQLEFNKIRAALLEFIDTIGEKDLQENEAARSKPSIYNGDVLYRIPHRMQKDVEVTCIVRLAFNKDELYIGLEKEKHDVVKDLRISDVMGVELIDPSENEAFAIRTYSEQVQFVEQGLPTEWLFFVKPLKKGTFPLILKISVIEIIKGVERKRNVVLEEKVQIVAEPVPEEEAREAGLAANLSTAVAGIALSGGTASAKGPEPAIPVAPAPAVEIADQRPGALPPPPAPKKSSGRKKLAPVLPVALAVVVGVWALTTLVIPDASNADPNLVKRFEKARKTGDIEELKNILETDPESELAQQTKSVLDSLDQAIWQDAVAENDPGKYLNRFPDGRFANEANEVLHNNNRITKNPVSDNHQVNAIEQDPRVTAPVIERVSDPSSETGNTGSNPEAAVPLTASARRPVYPGCKNSNIQKEEACTEKRIRRFVGKQLSYPEKALQNKIEGVVTVSFIVEKNGEISNVKTLNKLGYGCEEEAIRLVKQLPRFEPGRDAKGNPIRVLYQLPVRFRMRG